jgi:hypothetical protein
MAHSLPFCGMQEKEVPFNNTARCDLGKEIGMPFSGLKEKQSHILTRYRGYRLFTAATSYCNS